MCDTVDPALFDKPEFTVTGVHDVLGQAFRPKLGAAAGKGDCQLSCDVRNPADTRQLH
jgi:hypothetical protein